MQDKNNPITLGNQEKDFFYDLEVYKDTRKKKETRKTPKRLNQN
jgi:hypothetical protein